MDIAVGKVHGRALEQSVRLKLRPSRGGQYLKCGARVLSIVHGAVMSNSWREGKAEQAALLNVSILSQHSCCFIFMKLSGARVRLLSGVAMMTSVRLKMDYKNA